MKAKTNTLLIVVALLAYWVGLCNASAFYDPGAQRWLNRDPIEERGGINLFEFVKNSPESQVDPEGHDIGGGGTGSQNDPPDSVSWPTCGSINGRPVLCPPQKPKPPQRPPKPTCPTDPDVDDCWKQTKPPGLPQPGGPIGGIACEARQYGCLDCCEKKHPINGGSNEDYASCVQSCEDNYKRCTALKK
jgi:hypothetical protein